MNNKELIQAIRSEIKRLSELVRWGYDDAMDDLLSFLDTLENGVSETPIKAVKGRIYDFRRIKEIGYSSAKIEFEEIPELDDGDKVRVIILPKED